VSNVPQEAGCIFCGVEHQNVAISENGYVGHRCDDCGLIYISPRPRMADIEKIYACGNAYMAPEQHISRAYLKRLHAHHALSLITRYITSGSLLEIGAGAGFFLDEARRQGFEPYAIEPNPTQADFIENKLRIPCERQTLSLATFQHQQFDTIFHSDVISHFYDPIDAFRTMYAKLRPGGFLIFETGNFADVTARYLGAIPSFQYPDHLFFFGKRALTRLLEVTGFRPLKMYSYSILGELRFTKLFGGRSRGANGAGNHSPGAGWVQHIKERIRPVYYNVSHFLRYRAGSWMPKAGRPQTLIIVAQKV
jgi:2-polyprenyl-3-methyl-5-hydroxy-6-metoxy-1,4-benzoquinol methylase